MASRTLRGGLDSVVDEETSRLLAAKIAGVPVGRDPVRSASEVAVRKLESVEALGELFLREG